MSFTFEVVSPEKLLLSTQAELAEIPGEDGDLGILEGHAPMVVQLRGGVIRLTRADGGAQELFVAGGFAEITPDRTAVLADEALALEEITRAVAEARLAEAEDAYREATAKDADQVVREAAFRRVLSAQAMLDAAAR
ncbi:MAG: ATP synthase F1 subunit epsilon [Acetobacteraceae bacterium]|nr:ATP synthase F1 subunit epsilon [Acetobacteraceae bacterium]